MQIAATQDELGWWKVGSHDVCTVRQTACQHSSIPAGADISARPRPLTLDIALRAALAVALFPTHGRRPIDPVFDTRPIPAILYPGKCHRLRTLFHFANRARIGRTKRPDALQRFFRYMMHMVDSVQAAACVRYA